MTIESGIGSGNDYMRSSGTKTDINIVNYHFCVGGVVGQNINEVSGCYNYASIGGSSQMGGIVGFNMDNAKIQNCFNSGDIWYNKTSAGNFSIGGIASMVRNYDTVSSCTNRGTLHYQLLSSSFNPNRDLTYTANIAGQASNYATISNCSAWGSVEVSDEVKLWLSYEGSKYI